MYTLLYATIPVILNLIAASLTSLSPLYIENLGVYLSLTY